MNALQECKETVDQPKKMSPCEKHYFNQDNENRLVILRAMAIGLIPAVVAQTAPLAHGHHPHDHHRHGQHTGIPTKHGKTEASDTQQPNKQHLINETERRCRTMMLSLNGGGEDKPKSAWSVDQITHWLEENPVQNESCVCFILSMLRDTDGSGGIPFDNLADSSNHEGGGKTAKAAAAASEELSSERVKDQLSRWQQNQNLGMVNSKDHVIVNETVTSSAGAANQRSIPSEAVFVEEATARVAVAGNGAGRRQRQEEEEEGGGEEEAARRRARLQEERSRLLTRAVGLPGYSVERTLELQERLGVVPSNEMLFEEVKRRLAGMSRREILIKWLMDNPIEELEEMSQYQETIDSIQNNTNNETQNHHHHHQQQQQPRTLGSMQVQQPTQNLADAAQQQQQEQHPPQAPPSDNRFLQMEENPPLIFDHLLADLPETEGTPPDDDVVVVLDDTSTTLLATESDIEDESDDEDDEYDDEDEEFSSEHYGDMEPNDEGARHDPDGNQAVGSHHDSGLAETGHWNAPTTAGTTAQDRATSDGDTGINLSTIDTSLTKMTME